MLINLTDNKHLRCISNLCLNTNSFRDLKLQKMQTFSEYFNPIFKLNNFESRCECEKIELLRC